MITKRLAILSVGEDHVWRDELLTYMRPLERAGIFVVWHDGMLCAGDVRRLVVREVLARAELIVPLLSASFLADDGCHELIEYVTALRETGRTWVAPILLRHCLWEHSALARLNVLPSDRQPVSVSQDRSARWTSIVREIHALVQVPNRVFMHACHATSISLRKPPSCSIRRLPRSSTDEELWYDPVLEAQLPARFIGRTAELRAMHDHLAGSGAASRSVTIRGGSGVGKSSLALAYAYRHYDEYSGRVYWASAAGSPVDVLAAACPFLRWSCLERSASAPSDGANNEELARQSLRILAESSGRILLILDDVVDDGWAQFMPLFNVDVIVATELPCAAFGGVLHLEASGREDSLHLADSFACAWHEAEDTARERVIVHILRCRPIAVELAARTVLSSSIGWRRYESNLCDRILTSPGHEDTSGDQFDAFTATVDLAISLCGDALACSLLEALASFNAGYVRKNWIEAAAGATEDTGCQNAWRAIEGAGIARLGLRHAFVHAAIHAHLRALVPEATRKYCAVRASPAVLEWLKITDGKAASDHYYDDIRQVRHYIEAVPSAALRYAQKRLCAEIAAKLGEHFLHQRAFADARDALERAFTIAQNLDDADKQMACHPLSNLTWALAEAGDPPSVALLLERALVFFESLVDDENGYAAVYMCKLSTILMDLGDESKAQPLLERTVDVAGRVLGLDHPHTQRAIEHLAKLHDSTQHERA